MLGPDLAVVHASPTSTLPPIAALAALDMKIIHLASEPVTIQWTALVMAWTCAETSTPVALALAETPGQELHASCATPNTT